MNPLARIGILTFPLLILLGCGLEPSEGSGYPTPDASFTFTPTAPAVGQDVQFTDTSTADPTSWLWEFGDGSSSTAQNPSHQFSTLGIKTVTLTVRNRSGSDSATQTINVAGLAASYTFRPFLPAPGRTVQFTDTSLGGATAWNWQFGDGTTSQVQNPTHVYATSGTYVSTLTAQGSTGTDSTTRIITVSTEEVLPPTRRVDWTFAGVPGGIPDRTTVFRVLSPLNSLTEINAAIASCPVGQVVFLVAGTYNIGTIAFGTKSGITLRGAGAGRTVINSTAMDAISSAELSFMEQDGVALSGGFEKDSTTLILSSPPTTSFRSGNLVQVTQADYSGSLGTPGVGVFHRIGFPGVWGMSTSRNLRFTSRIVSVSGTTIRLADPVPYDFSAELNPRIYPLRDGPGISLCGVENLTIRGGAGTDKAINFSGADRCWVKDVEIESCLGQLGMVFFRHSSQCEIRRCYAHDARGFPNQNDGYAFFFYYGCSYCLAVDNIACRVGDGMIVNGSSANAILFNMTENVRRAGHSWVDQGVIINHGPHGIMNLVEGNLTQRFQNDGYHGSTSHTTLFRNHVHGARANAVDPRRPIDLCRGSYLHNVIGNVIGDDSWNPSYYDLVTNPTAIACIYALGFPGMDSVSMSAYSSVPWEGWTKSTSVPDPDVAGTLIRHGNYDFFHRSVIWDPDIVSRQIPDSLFYSSKPSFFGSLQWPPIGPDVAGFVTPIPAKARWDAYSASANLDDLFRDL